MFAMSHKPHVVIVGGGLAGLSAAVRLAQSQRARVTLLETRRKLGGRATSFIDPKSGEQVDNCQHVLMKCCTYLIDLYKRLGVYELIEWHDRLHFVGEHGEHDVLRRQPFVGILPGARAPFHLTRSILGFRSLTFAEKRALARAMFAMMRLGDRRLDMDGQTFGDWLATQRQPQSLIDKFWQLVIVSACNEPVERVSCKYAMQVFIEGFLGHEDAYVMGVSKAPLVSLYDPAVAAIEQAGGEVRLGAGVEELVFDENMNRVTAARLTRGGEVEGDIFISALTADRLAKVSTDAMRRRDARLQRLDEFDYTPIVGMHLFISRQAGELDVPFASGGGVALMNRPLHWVFDKGPVDNEHGPSHYFHGVISGANDLMDTPAAEIVAMALDELRRAFPQMMAGRELVHGNAVKEKRATFACVAGVDALRPPPRKHPRKQ